MDLNTLIIEDIGEAYTMLNISYIKIMVLFTILLVFDASLVIQRQRLVGHL